VNLPPDAYGAAIYAFIYDARELLSSKDHDSKPCWLNLYRLVYVMVVLFVNYIFQFLMLYWIMDFVVQPSVHNVQKQYQSFHADFFSEDGQFLIEEWDGRQSHYDSLYKQQLCQMVFSKFTFLAFVLMLWAMIMVIELRRNMKLLVDIFKVPSCPSSNPAMMIKDASALSNEKEVDGDRIMIVGLTPSVRVLTILLIVMPKFVIGFALTTLGMLWLSATESFSELILNSLALVFVIGIDDYLFDALLPESYREDMDNVVLQIPKKRLDLIEGIEEDWRHWKASTFFFIFIPSFVFMYLKCLQLLPLVGVLPNFKDDMKDACGPYLDAHKKQICTDPLSYDCFSYGGWQPTHKL
jgi:hypothetical protein